MSNWFINEKGELCPHINTPFDSIIIGFTEFNYYQIPIISLKFYFNE